MRHMDRNFAVLGLNDQGTVSPYYFQVLQYGMTYQQAISDVLLKFEGAVRNYMNNKWTLPNGTVYQQKNHAEAALGIEKTWYKKGGTEITGLFEITSIFGVSNAHREAMAIFQRECHDRGSN